MDYPKEKLWELYKSIPKKLQTAVFSEKVADIIFNVCKKNGVKDEKIIRGVAKHIGYVLLGIIPPDEFQSILEKEIKIRKVQAKDIALAINKRVFSPIKKELEALYGQKTKIPESAQTEAVKKEPAKPEKKDKYQESLE